MEVTSYMKEKIKKDRKKPKHIRDAEKAKHAEIYSEGYKHGYSMGLEMGKKLNETV